MTGVWQAYRQVLRYIHQRDLQPGDRLPPHCDLRTTLGLGNNVLHEAMELMAQDGILRRAQKAGTVVCNLWASRRPLWQVGVLQDSEASGYFALLQQFARHHLAQMGCRDRTYTRKPATLNRLPRQVGFYEHLESDIEHGLLDAAFTTKTMQGLTIPLGGTADCPAVCAGCAIDEHAFGRQAGQILLEKGCRSILVVTPIDEPWLGLCQALQEAGRSVRGLAKRLSLSVEGQVPAERGLALGDSLLAMSAAARPDGIVMHDDQISVGLLNRLYDVPGYRPTVVVQTLKQAPPWYPLAPIRLEVDVDELARLAVQALVRHIHRPSQARVMQYLAPTLRQGTAVAV